MSEQKIFFTGDLHLGHKDILIYEREFRLFKSIEEMHEKIIETIEDKNKFRNIVQLARISISKIDDGGSSPSVSAN